MISLSTLSKEYVTRTAIWAAMVFMLAPSHVVACGFHDPVMLSRGLLTWRYENALYVTGAIWDAQKAGQLEMPDRERLVAMGPERERLDREAYRRAVAAVSALGAAMDPVERPANMPGVALVLLEGMLWTRY